MDAARDGRVRAGERSGWGRETPASRSLNRLGRLAVSLLVLNKAPQVALHSGGGRSPRVACTDRVRSVMIDDSEGFIYLVTRLLSTDRLDVAGAAGDSEHGPRPIDDLPPDVVIVDL